MCGERKLLQQLVADLNANSRLVMVGESVSRDLTSLANEMAMLIREEIDSYGAADDKDFLRAGWQHGYAHAEKIGNLLQRQSVGDLQFVLDHATQRAQQRFPLNDILHTYRIGHRVMWSFMRDVCMRHAGEREEGLSTAMQLADFTIRYTNLISVVLTRGYLECEKQLVSSRVRQTHRLFDELMQGQLVSPACKVLADSLGMGRKPYFVCGIENIEYADRTVGVGEQEALERQFHKFGIDVLLDDRHEHPRALLIAKSATTGLRERVLRACASTQGARFGVSLEAAAESDFPFAVAEATAALNYTNTRTRTVDLQSLPIHQIYLDNHHLKVERLLPAWYEELTETDAGSAGALRQTIQAYADSDLSVKRTAHRLGLHPNTVRFRIAKIERITALSPKSFRGLQELLTVLMLGARSHSARIS